MARSIGPTMRECLKVLDSGRCASGSYWTAMVAGLALHKVLPERWECAKYRAALHRLEMRGLVVDVNANGETCLWTITDAGREAL